MQDRKDVTMELFPRVLPVDIPLRSLSITHCVCQHEQGQIDVKKKSLKIHRKASGTECSFLYSMFNWSLSNMVDLVNENMLLFTFFCSWVSPLLTFPPPGVERDPQATNKWFWKSSVCVYRSVRACRQLLFCPVSWNYSKILYEHALHA